MDFNLLHLKPNVIIKNTEIESDTQKTDQPIRPYPNINETDIAASSQSRANQTSRSDNDSQIHARNDSADVIAEDYDRLESTRNHMYQLVHMNINENIHPSFMYAFVVMRYNVYYQNVEVLFPDSEEAEMDQKTSPEFNMTSETARIKAKDSPMSTQNSVCNRSEYELKKESFISICAGESHCDDIFDCFKFDPDPFESLGITSYFVQTPITITVLPVHRQSKKQGQNAGNPNDSQDESLPPSQPPDRTHLWPPDKVYDLPWATFRQELYRLGTFVGKPPTFPVFTLRLAQVGFLCLPDGTIRCYFCGLLQDDWHAGDVPDEIHKQLSPHCPTLTGEAGNIPVTIPQDVEELMDIWSVPGPFLLSVRDPNLQRREMLAAVGSTPAASEVTSTNNITINTTGLEQNAAVSMISQQLPGYSEASASRSALSQSSAPAVANNENAGEASSQVVQNPSGANDPSSGPLHAQSGNGEGDSLNETVDVRNAEQIPLSGGTAQPEGAGSVQSQSAGSEPLESRQVVTYLQLGIMTETPKHMNMATVNARVETFRDWSAQHSQTPLSLAEAGFFYAGYADCGRCFFCGGGLKNWDSVDNPWVEHARWFPKCTYVRQCQGQDFIDIIQEFNSQNENQPITLTRVTDELRRRHTHGEHRIQEPIVDPAIVSALEVGYSQEAIDNAVQSLHTEGYLLTVDRLLNTLQEQGAVATFEGGSLPEDSELGDLDELMTTNQEMRQQRMCKICLDREACIVFLPCGHLVSCAECSPALRNCPMCRQRVKGRVRAFPA